MQIENKIKINTNTTRLMSYIIIVGVLLATGCSNNVEKVSSAPLDAKGVGVIFPAELINSQQKPGALLTVTLMVDVVDNGTAQELPILNNGAWINRDELKLPDATDIPPSYVLQVFYTDKPEGSQEKILVAEGRYTGKETRIKFGTADYPLHLDPYDQDGNSSIDANEIAALDNDQDTASNLKEILAGGNPRNRLPTFLSSTSVSLVEGQSNGDSFYTAIAISPRKDAFGAQQAISYGILSTATDSLLLDLISIDVVSGELFIQAGKKPPPYVPNANNSYTITLTATDSPENTATLPLILNITDIFNLSVQVSIKSLDFSWEPVSDSNGPADYYKLLEDLNGDNNFKELLQPGSNGELIPLELVSSNYSHNMTLFLTAINANTQYKLEAYRRNTATSIGDTLLTTSSTLVLNDAVKGMQNLIALIGYFKATNSSESDKFGYSVALSADGYTLAVGAPREGSTAMGVGGDQSNDCDKSVIEQVNCQSHSGAVYVFHKNNNSWQLQAYVKATNTGMSDSFGISVAISADGGTLAVGAPNESGATPVILHQSDIALGTILGDVDNIASGAGAVYVYRLSSGVWQPQAYIKASTLEKYDNFGQSVALSANGLTLAVGATGENSDSIGVYDTEAGNDCYLLNQNPPAIPSTPNCKQNSGAVYVFLQQNNRWQSQAYIKASNPATFDGFGGSLAISGDASTLVVGAIGEDNGVGGVNNGQQINDCYLLDSSPPATPPTSVDCALNSGAAYVFSNDSTGWKQQAYIKAVGPSIGSEFGYSVALDSDGLTLAVGAPAEYSRESRVYLLKHDVTGWLHQSYIRSNGFGVGLGSSVALSADGSTLAVGENASSIAATGVWNQFPVVTPGAAINAGAAYIYQYESEVWLRRANIYASNSKEADFFGTVALSADGGTLAVGAIREAGSAKGIGGDQANDCELASRTPPEIPTKCVANSGAVYLY